MEAWRRRTIVARRRRSPRAWVCAGARVSQPRRHRLVPRRRGGVKARHHIALAARTRVDTTTHARAVTHLPRSGRGRSNAPRPPITPSRHARGDHPPTSGMPLPAAVVSPKWTSSVATRPHAREMARYAPREMAWWHGRVGRLNHATTNGRLPREREDGQVRAERDGVVARKGWARRVRHGPSRPVTIARARGEDGGRRAPNARNMPPVPSPLPCVRATSCRTASTRRWHNTYHRVSHRPPPCKQDATHWTAGAGETKRALGRRVKEKQRAAHWPRSGGCRAVADDGAPRSGPQVAVRCSLVVISCEQGVNPDVTRRRSHFVVYRAPCRRRAR